MRKIAAITGSRAEYDILYPVLKLMQESVQFELNLIVTGPHLSEMYGRTVENIERDGFTIADRIYNLVNTNQKIGRIISLGNQIPAIAQTFDRLKPDFVIVVGDREEAISATMTAAFMDIAAVHIAGGDIAKDGNIDNAVRYAAGKFAHIHFTILEQHKKNLIKMGEDEWRIFTVGNPALDRFVTTPYLSIRQLSDALHFDLDMSPFLVLIQHPIITNYEQEAYHIRQTLDAILETGLKCLINYPNSDPGNYPLIEAYKEYTAKNAHLFLFQNLDRIIYVNLLRHAACLLGNSSSGLLEAPSLGLPVVNIGPRQRGRVHAENVIFVDNKKQEILNALNHSLYNDSYRSEVKKCKNPYGDGNSAKKIVNILAELPINSALIHKNITY
ncbi:UDP-N-acetylglucosamine 2-epimerase (hydrolyzing) [Sphingobacteriales bacterium UPWRP_1]|nr:UDP-N-acetylglucosamine 2-epimerase (hydrolyzing) [Sphingobacteriales bacterium TSM_CSS]PSJ76694.1 UDP-N-acetylglucosamine 2-epimerase (hydrolyzing) [Sphingobacteriales bacterium UPWRP_1]